MFPSTLSSRHFFLLIHLSQLCIMYVCACFTDAPIFFTVHSLLIYSLRSSSLCIICTLPSTSCNNIVFGSYYTNFESPLIDSCQMIFPASSCLTITISLSRNYFRKQSRGKCEATLKCVRRKLPTSLSNSCTYILFDITKINKTRT